MMVQFNEKPYRITEILKETPDVNLFRLESEDKALMDFDPGMFIMLGCIDPVTKEKIARAYSIASAPSQNFIELYIHMIHGKFTSHLDTAKVGDIYYVSGPHGQFRFSAATDKKVLFLIGGTGLAPCMSMLKEVKSKNSGTDVVLLYSVRYPNEIIRKDELAELEKQVALKKVVTVTRPAAGDGWTGQTGHIDAEMIKRYSPDFLERKAYICGPLPFVKSIKDALLSLGVKEESIKADVWG
jgi:ferredoxin-NADP reductase